MGREAEASRHLHSVLTPTFTPSLPHFLQNLPRRYHRQGSGLWSVSSRRQIIGCRRAECRLFAGHQKSTLASLAPCAAEVTQWGAGEGGGQDPRLGSLQKGSEP